MIGPCQRTRVPKVALSIGALSALVACSSGSSGGAPPIPVTARGSASTTQTLFGSKIKHVIVVILENRSFDNLFSADTALQSVTDPPVDVNSAETANIAGKGVEAVEPDSLSASEQDADHSHQGFMRQFDHGKGDGWYDNTVASPGTTELGYVPANEVQPYYDIAKQFAISDRFFHGITAPTFPSHVEIGGATTYGIIDNPSDNTWGCDAKPGTTTGLFDPNAPTEEDNGAGPFPCFDELSIFDLMDRANVSWEYYVAGEGDDITGNLNIASYYRHIRYGPDWNNDIAKDDAVGIAAVAAGTLPQVSFLIPNDGSTDHAGEPSLGPTYIETLVNDLGASGQLDSTLMMITWDDWGGWYDHVVPPLRPNGLQLSWRKPIIFVGGYVKHNYCTHVQTEDASIAKTIEEIFGLGTLGANDLAANGFDDVIDLTQTPPAFTPITSTQGADPQDQGQAAGSLPPAARRLGGKYAMTKFRVVPGNFLRYMGDKGPSLGKDDYYGARSADY